MVVSKPHFAVAVARLNGQEISGNSCARTDRILRARSRPIFRSRRLPSTKCSLNPPNPLSCIGSVSLLYILPPLLQIYRLLTGRRHGGDNFEKSEQPLVSVSPVFLPQSLKPIHRSPTASHRRAEAEKTNAGARTKDQSTAWTMATSNSTDTQRQQVRKPPDDPDAAGKEENQAIEWHECYLDFGRLSRNSIFLPQLAHSTASAFRA